MVPMLAWYLWLIIGVAIGMVVLGMPLGWLARKTVVEKEVQHAQKEAARILATAQKEAADKKREAIVEAREALSAERSEFEQEVRQTRQELLNLEKKISKREDVLEQKVTQFEERERQMKTQEKTIAGQQASLARKNGELEELLRQQESQLERISGLTALQARDQLFKNLELTLQRERALAIKRHTDETQEVARQKARDIIISSLQRVANDEIAEVAIASVALPNDDMKGRIIGREGRNIRAFEQITGINLIIDDTPEAVVLSGFDPIRREAARRTLERLVSDGRIHPGRIEEVFNKVQQEIDEIMRQAGETATFELAVNDLNPELIQLLGRLKFRTSYGQNVLQHSVEVARLASMIAAEVGADRETAKRGGLLHDIGKANDWEVEGSHVEIGLNLCKKAGINPLVLHCIEAHHGDKEATTAEAVIVQLADALSASRPGARRETIETYIKRLENLEAIAGGFSGVERCFALSAGREVRIVVEPEKVDDAGAAQLAYDISRKIEQELQYPGSIKVSVVRETRAVDYAK